MATIIRRDNAAGIAARSQPSGVVVQPMAFSFADMHSKADDYLDTVRAETAKIVQQAHQQAERIRRQAEVAGREAAQAEIERILDEKVGKRMETLLPALEQLVSQMNDAKGELLSQWEQSAVQVCTAIAERVIRRQLDRQPEIALDTIAEALRLAAGAPQLRLHVNPTDYEQLGTQVDRLAATLGRIAPTDIVADPEVAPGGCRVLSTSGEIDQRIESQLRRIEEELK